jgi:hypothetical protein
MHIYLLWSYCRTRGEEVQHSWAVHMYARQSGVMLLYDQKQRNQMKMQEWTCARNGCECSGGSGHGEDVMLSDKMDGLAEGCAPPLWSDYLQPLARQWFISTVWCTSVCSSPVVRPPAISWSSNNISLMFGPCGCAPCAPVLCVLLVRHQHISIWFISVFSPSVL